MWLTGGRSDLHPLYNLINSHKSADVWTSADGMVAVGLTCVTIVALLCGPLQVRIGFRSVTCVVISMLRIMMRCSQAQWLHGLDFSFTDWRKLRHIMNSARV